MKKTDKDIERKALIVTTVASTLDQFCMNDIKILQKTHKVYVAANFNSGNNTSVARVKEFKLELESQNIVVHDIQFRRSPFSLKNIVGYKEIKKVLENNHFDLIHCHTPVAAMVTRVAASSIRRKGTKVIYTAHGFHFYKGAPLKNWLLFYPVERWLARYTDLLITINKEDYIRAKKSFRPGKVEYLPGVGINIDKFSKVKVNKYEKLKELNLPNDAFVLLSVGELNKNKNHETVIKAISILNNPNLYYIICGQGSLENQLKDLIKELKLENKIKLLGFRKDIPEICKVSDIFIFPSFREGLSVALMEAMASELSVVCSNIRGNSDLIENGKGGFLVEPDNVKGFATAIDHILKDVSLKEEFKRNNLDQINMYSIDRVTDKMAHLYNSLSS
ncbi:glycosyltransferase family 4 protein [Rossellomorea vietnamensis]|uniref:glycosyltransferase family 4 protein n=1 Tax=Rossellomorea vietnamensis TaxID=218284 RepID=UPI003CEB0371